MVRVSNYNCGVDELRIKTAFEVIALAGGEQRWRAKPSPVDIIAGFRKTAAVRGVAYFWAGKYYSPYDDDDDGSGMVLDLALFDLAIEEWRPTIIHVYQETDHVQFEGLDGCLVIIHHKGVQCSTDLWFLTDTDNALYWTKRYAMRCAPHWEHTLWHPPCPLVILEDGRIVAWLEKEKLYVLVVYDPKSQAWNNFATLDYYFAIGVYQGSLLASDLQGWSLAPSSDGHIID